MSWHRDCLDTELNNNAPSFSSAPIYYSYAIVVLFSRGGRSVAQHNFYNSFCWAHMVKLWIESSSQMGSITMFWFKCHAKESK